MLEKLEEGEVEEVVHHNQVMETEEVDEGEVLETHDED